MAEFIGGTALKAYFVDGAGTVDLTSKFTKISWKTSARAEDRTAGNDLWERKLPGLAKFSVTFKGFFDDAAGALGTADMARLTPRTTGLFFFGPQGTATGKPKFGGSVIVTTSDQEIDYSKPVELNIEFEGDGKPYWNYGSAF